MFEKDYYLYVIKALIMRRLFLCNSTKSVKMRTVNCLSILMLIMLPFVSNAASALMGVTFGNPQSNGGECVGKGVCRESLDLDVKSGMYLTAPEAVAVTFIINETNPNMLLMRFSKSELMAKQPRQFAYFSNADGYSFDSPYLLSKPVFSSLGLPIGSTIQSNKSFTVQIAEDLITVYIPLSRG